MASKILKALDDASGWLDYEGVEGIGQGKKDDKDCINVYISRPTSELSTKIPKKFKGFQVVYQESGHIDIQ